MAADLQTVSAHTLLAVLVLSSTTPNRAPFFTLSYFSAPRFCPMKVVSAMLKLVIGRKAKPSSFE